MACQPFPTLDHVIQPPAKAGTFGGSPIGQHLIRNDLSEVPGVRISPRVTAALRCLSEPSPTTLLSVQVVSHLIRPAATGGFACP